MKKKIGAILAAGAMACTMTVGVAFSGCGVAKTAEFEMPAGGYDGSKVSITFANTTGQALADIIDSAIERFNVLYPNITVKNDNSEKQYPALNSKIATQLTGGKQPNVAFCYSDHVAQYNQSKAVLPLDDFLPGGAYSQSDDAAVKSLALTEAQVKDYIDVFYKEGSVYEDGKTYTLPFAKSTEVLFYNKDFFDAHPDIKVPETWDEMEQTCADIKAIIGDDKSKYPLVYDSDANLFITLCNQYGSDYTSATGDHFLFDNETNRGFVADLKRWYDAGYFTTEGLGGTYGSNLFKEQKCYMSIGSTGGSQYQDPGSTDGQAKFYVEVAPLPQKDPDNFKSILQGPSVCIFKKNNPQEVIASWLLVKFLTTDIEFQARYSEQSGYMPVTWSTFNSEAYQDFLSEIDSASGLTARAAKTCYELAQKEGAFYTSDAFIGSSKARERVELLIIDVLDNGTSIEDAFKAAVKACNDFVKQ